MYRATDTKLNRQVALKILPEAFASDPDRLARFQREAQVLASLNHPNIAQIHGLEESEDTRALVLELVEGPTLADRISKGPIPVDKALPIAKQIAEALEAAHEAGVIHRDLKPANIKVKDDGTVKVLDFGLAKAFDTTPEGDPSQSPTLTAAATQMGVIMGTAAYMSPEQAKGKVADKRADVWAFGIVLFEMLTGKRVFGGETVSETLADVMKSDPKWDTLPTDLPSVLSNLIRRCLEKDPRQRMRDIGDVRLAMEGAFETTVGASPTTVPQPARGRQAFPLVVAASAVVSIVTGVAVWTVARSGSPALRSRTRFAITLPASDQLVYGNIAPGAALSADGETVVYVVERDGVLQLYRRLLDQLEGLPIPGTEGASYPFFSPDAEWIGFRVDGALKRMALAGGPPVTLYDGTPQASDASWGTNDVIVFGTGGEAQPIMQVAPTGEVMRDGTTCGAVDLGR